MKKMKTNDDTVRNTVDTRSIYSVLNNNGKHDEKPIW